MLIFPQISFFDRGKCARSQTVRHEMDWNCFEILYSHFNFITGTKKKQYSMWNMKLSSAPLNLKHSGGGGNPPIPLRKKSFFFSHWFSVKGLGGGGTPLTEKIRQIVFDSLPKSCLSSPMSPLLFAFYPPRGLCFSLSFDHNLSYKWNHPNTSFQAWYHFIGDLRMEADVWPPNYIIKATHD